RDNPKTARRGHGCEARYGLLDHGVLAVERKQLLGAALPAERPEPRASAASQNHGIEVRGRFHVVESLPSAHRAAKSSPQGATGSTGNHRVQLGATNLCLSRCTSVLPVVRIFLRYYRVAGSGIVPLGTELFKNSTAHCGRTVKPRSAAGITT